MDACARIDLPLPLYKRGKVRDVFEAQNRLLIVSTDRISAFDYVLPSLIPDKGKVLNQLAAFFFALTRDVLPNHLLSDRPEELPDFKPFARQIAGRAVLAKKMRGFPLEAIVRDYLVGSGWKTYQANGTICGLRLPAGLSFADRLPEPIFTPTTKAETGHDQDMTLSELAGRIGQERARRIRELSLLLFAKVSEFAYQRGIIIADSKFEFGQDEEGRIVLIDEIFTPDSSRFWKREDYAPGREPPSYDKQFVRNFLLDSSWDRQSPPPQLPADIVARTREKYLEIFRILTGREL